MSHTYNIGVKKLAPDGTEIICFFTKKFIYSNFFLCDILIDGHLFCCSEQYYMFQKALCYDELGLADAILKSKVPFEIKKLGTDVEKKVRAKTGNFDKAQWHRIAIQIMMIACREKFRQNSHLGQHLLETKGAILVEASKTDFYWGAGKSMDQIMDTNWNGKNVLGRLLMVIRKHMLAEQHLSHVKRRIQEKHDKKNRS